MWIIFELWWWWPWFFFSINVFECLLVLDVAFTGDGSNLFACEHDNLILSMIAVFNRVSSSSSFIFETSVFVRTEYIRSLVAHSKLTCYSLFGSIYVRSSSIVSPSASSRFLPGFSLTRASSPTIRWADHACTRHIFIYIERVKGRNNGPL